jgi:bifunctional DNA-binding transcriptional regulator/antitoxin component of YhaV-PrlF toxin-antitoxin module
MNKLLLGLIVWYNLTEFLQLRIYSKELVMDVVIQVRNRGVITLPADLREKYGIENGDIFRLVDLDGVFVLTPMVPMVPELAREIEQARLEAGLSIEDLLQGLREQRRRYVREKYGAGEEGGNEAST